MITDNKIILTLCSLIGFSLTVFYLGFENLGLTNTSWITKYDTISDFLALKFFIKDSWHLPIGLNPQYGELKNAIVFSGAVPLLSFLSKLIGIFLPYNFHFFSIWIFLCFTLHIFFAYKIIFYLTKNVNFAIISSLFFLFTPILFQRLEMHLSLGAHWLIMAFIYLEINIYIKNKIFLKTILIVLSSLIHFYFTIMILMLNFIFSFDHYLKLKNFKHIVNENLTPIIFLVLTMYSVGYFSIPASDALGFGYGFYKANLLTFFDPTSGYGNQNWSLILPDIKNSKGEYEGYGYLGFGVIVLLFVLLYYILNDFKKTIKNNNKYILVAFLFLLVAFSSSINFGAKNIIDINLPLYLYAPLSIIRASGRFIWPVYYLLIIFSIFAFYKLKLKIKYLIVILFLQLIDLAPGIYNSYGLDSKKANYRSDQFFKNEIIKNFDKIKTTKISNTSNIFPKVSSLMIENNFSVTNISRLGRYNRQEASKLRTKLYLNLIEKKIDNKTIYIIDNVDHLRHLKFLYNKSKHGFFYRNDIWFFLPNLKDLYDNNDKEYFKKIEFLELKLNHNYKIQSKLSSGILGLGWSHPSYGRNVSANGAWTEGHISSFLFKKNNLTKINTIMMNFEKIMNIKNKPLIVDIYINDIFFEKLNLREKKDTNIILNTKNSNFLNGINVIDFKIRNPVTPISRYDSVDGRLLGFLINTVEFR